MPRRPSHFQFPPRFPFPASRLLRLASIMWIPRRCRFIGRRKAISLTVGGRPIQSRQWVSSFISSDSLTFKQIHEFFEKFETYFASAKIWMDTNLSSSLYNFDVKYLNDCTSQVTSRHLTIIRDFDERTVELLMFRATLRACYASRRLKRSVNPSVMERCLGNRGHETSRRRVACADDGWRCPGKN